MATFRHSLDAAAPDACRAGVLIIGNFDGVHRGHQALAQEAARQAHALGCFAVAVTFDPHPLQLLRPAAFQPLLTTIDHRAELLRAAGADHVLILETTAELLRLSARDFFIKLICESLQARALVEGYNFAFGKGRAGTPEVLRSLCAEAGLPLTLLPPQEVLGKPASSSRVRGELLAGQLDTVKALLGRPYRIAGTVVAGQRRGQTLGFPTANLDHIRTLIPGNGVYAVRAIHGGKVWPAAANVGPNPTFGEKARKVEVHLIGFAGDLYGQELAVEFIEKLRDTQPFANVQELVAQLRADIERARLAVY
jgi:riboflavin kinase/FMN adenylyltransferase